MLRHVRRPRPRLSLLALAGLSGIVLTACTSAAGPQTSGAPTTTAANTPAAADPTCPLTGTPVPGGGDVPRRPALAVKVDNYPAARPQSGIDKADVIFEEPVEGGITRYVAVFQCQDAGLVGPVRSARNIDIGILGQLGNPLEVHVGGIEPVLANLNASPIVNVDLGSYGSIITNPPGRSAPYDTYSSTSRMWGTHPTMSTPPQPLFTYSTTVPSGTPVSSVNIDFSHSSNVTWKYNPTTNEFQRYYNGTIPDTLADGTQNAAANVIVQYVHISYGPWLENNQGGSKCRPISIPTPAGRLRCSATALRSGPPGSVPRWPRPPNSPPRPGRPSRSSPDRHGSSWFPTPLRPPPRRSPV